MTENDEGNGNGEGESIDYNASQSAIDKAKQKARDDDAKRLTEEHE